MKLKLDQLLTHCCEKKTRKNWLCAKQAHCFFEPLLTSHNYFISLWRVMSAKFAIAQVPPLSAELDACVEILSRLGAVPLFP